MPSTTSSRKSSISSGSVSTPSPRSGALGRAGALGILLSVLLLWWTLHDVRLGEVWDRLRGIRPLPFLAAIALATLGFPLRTVRWRYLLRLEGEALPFVPLWHATAIGFMANNLLPARAGEVARAYAARRLTSVRFTTALGSIGVERVMDGLTLVTFLIVAIAAGGFAPGTTVGGVALADIAQGTGVLFAILLAISIAVVHRPVPVLRITRRVTHAVLPDRWGYPLLQVVEGLLSGLEALRSLRRFAAVALWSFVVWIVMAASFWAAFAAFGIAVPWSAAAMLQALIAFGVAVPSSPGFFGVFEAVSRVTLALYGVEAGLAVSYAVGYHLATFLPITLLGIWSLSRAHLHLAELREPVPAAGEGATP